MAKLWTIDLAHGEAVRLAFNARQAVAGAPWCDDLIVRSPAEVHRQAYLGPEGFDALVALVVGFDALAEVAKKVVTIHQLIADFIDSGMSDDRVFALVAEIHDLVAVPD